MSIWREFKGFIDVARSTKTHESTSTTTQSERLIVMIFRRIVVYSLMYRYELRIHFTTWERVFSKSVSVVAFGDTISLRMSYNPAEWYYPLTYRIIPRFTIKLFSPSKCRKMSRDTVCHFESHRSDQWKGITDKTLTKLSKKHRHMWLLGQNRVADRLPLVCFTLSTGTLMIICGSCVFASKLRGVSAFMKIQRNGMWLYFIYMCHIWNLHVKMMEKFT